MAAPDAPAGLNTQLLQAARQGDAQRVRDLLLAGAEPFHQETERGSSALMHAAASGSVGAVAALLEAGAPWNALDRFGKCAGDYAIEAGHQEVIDKLVDHAVTVEQLLGRIERRTLQAEREERQGNLPDSAEYLVRHVRYEGDKLLDDASDGVMMAWETPLMRAHAELLCGPNADRDVLNVGFGMGIVDSFIQQFGCRTHTIIEAHPEVHRKMLADGWDRRPGVRIAFGRWQDVIQNLGPFDAIFYDTYAEHYTDMQDFHDLLPRLLRPGGLYSFFNGLAPKNVFFHAVACQNVQLELQHLGFEVEFRSVDIEVDDQTWEGVRRKYWHDRKQYFLPVATYYPEEEDEGAGMDRPEEATLTQGDAPAALAGVLAETSAEELLLGEAPGPDGRPRPVQLRARLDSRRGGLRWVPEPLPAGPDVSAVSMLRTWFPPMLHDDARNALYAAALPRAVAAFAAAHGRPPVVLDIGSGTGLLSLLACRAGAAHVYACEGFAALAELSRDIVRRAGEAGRVTVIAKRSTDVVVGVDLPGPCDLVVSEILDSALIGEGVLPSLRDAHRRLLAPGAPSVPARATVWGRLVASDTLRRMHRPAADAVVALPPCSGGRSLVPLHFEALQDAEFLSDSVRLFDFEFAQIPVTEDPRHARRSATVTRTGRPDGLLIFWTLELIPGLELYTTEPGVEPWQDHWPQTLWPFANPLDAEVLAGQEVVLDAMHDDFTVWANLQAPQAGPLPSPAAPPGCSCGLHGLLSPHRFLSLNALFSPQSSVGQALQLLPQNDLVKVLDVCDGSALGLLLAKSWPNAQVYGLNPHPKQRAAALALAQHNRLPAFAVWAGPGVAEWPVEWGAVDLLMGDGYFQQFQNRPLWTALNFWYLRSALQPLLRPGAVVLPRRAHIMAAAVEFRRLAACHGAVDVVCGFDHRPLAEAQRAASEEEAELPLHLWEYEHTFLTDPTALLALDFQLPLPAGDADWPAEEIRLEVPVQTAGTAHAVVLWTDVDVTNDPSCRVDGRHQGWGGAKQAVRWLPAAATVQPGAHTLHAAARMDLRAGSLTFAFEFRDTPGHPAVG